MQKLKSLRSKFLILIFSLALAACTDSSVTQDAAVDAAWRALDPVTTAHNRANFEVGDARLIKAEEVIQRFANERMNSYCWGTRVPANATIDLGATYWYVHLKHRAMTPIPITRVSPTQPPAIPDWNIPEAFFLIDARTGNVVARAIACMMI
ncbi:MAG: hypothetical protein HZC40_21550 [Chloroflexi bacterium]|nr:hypothetical protein [Chloroflexota bacterium]